jgi:hypothetical protein
LESQTGVLIGWVAPAPQTAKKTGHLPRLRHEKPEAPRRILRYSEPGFHFMSDRFEDLEKVLSSFNFRLLDKTIYIPNGSSPDIEVTGITMSLEERKKAELFGFKREEPSPLFWPMIVGARIAVIEAVKEVLYHKYDHSNGNMDATYSVNVRISPNAIITVKGTSMATSD